jgi:hypothetical protein
MGTPGLDYSKPPERSLQLAAILRSAQSPLDPKLVADTRWRAAMSACAARRASETLSETLPAAGPAYRIPHKQPSCAGEQSACVPQSVAAAKSELSNSEMSNASCAAEQPDTGSHLAPPPHDAHADDLPERLLFCPDDVWAEPPAGAGAGVDPFHDDWPYW